jgi:ABC-2 type transport system permease protein
MWRRIRSLVVKELLAILRDPKGRLILIVPPLLQLVVFSYAATLEVRNVRVVVLNEDAGRWGHELVHRIEGSPTFLPPILAEGPVALREAIDAQRAIAAVRIGPGFSRDLAAGRPAALQVILDGRRSNAAQIVAGYLTRISEGLAEEAAGRPHRPRPRGEAIAARNWFNPNLDFVRHTVPGLIAIISMLVGLVVTALSVAREREVGTFDQLMVSPLRTWEILVGKTVPPMMIGFFHTTLFALAAVHVFEVPLHGSIALLYASLVFYLAALIGIGLFISASSSTQQQAILGAFLFASPAILLSGFATPVENMPGWLQYATLANPLRHFLVICKGVFLKDLPAQEVLAGTLPLALIAAVTLAAAAWQFRRRME